MTSIGKYEWRLAEAAAHDTPYSMQNQRDRARGDCDGLRNDLAAFVVQALGDDETGFLQEGHHSAGVQHQYGGTAGLIQHCQIGVFLSYAIRHGWPMLSRKHQRCNGKPCLRAMGPRAELV